MSPCSCLCALQRRRVVEDWLARITRVGLFLAMALPGGCDNGQSPAPPTPTIVTPVDGGAVRIIPRFAERPEARLRATLYALHLSLNRSGLYSSDG